MHEQWSYESTKLLRIIKNLALGYIDHVKRDSFEIDRLSRDEKYE